MASVSFIPSLSSEGFFVTSVSSRNFFPVYLKKLRAQLKGRSCDISSVSVTLLIIKEVSLETSISITIMNFKNHTAMLIN